MRSSAPIQYSKNGWGAVPTTAGSRSAASRDHARVTTRRPCGRQSSPTTTARSGAAALAGDEPAYRHATLNGTRPRPAQPSSALSEAMFSHLPQRGRPLLTADSRSWPALREPPVLPGTECLRADIHVRRSFGSTPGHSDACSAACRCWAATTARVGLRPGPSRRKVLLQRGQVHRSSVIPISSHLKEGDEADQLSLNRNFRSGTCRPTASASRQADTETSARVVSGREQHRGVPCAGCR